MSEETMIAAVQQALKDRGIDDELVAVGQFYPRGHTGGAFAGGLIGSEVGGELGELGDAIGTVGGYAAGLCGADSASGLPSEMLVGVSAANVYGFGSIAAGRALRSRLSTPARGPDREGAPACERPRARAHRHLEWLPDRARRNRLPITHSKDVIQHLE